MKKSIFLVIGPQCRLISKWDQNKKNLNAWSDDLDNLAVNLENTTKIENALIPKNLDNTSNIFQNSYIFSHTLDSAAN